MVSLLIVIKKIISIAIIPLLLLIFNLIAWRTTSPPSNGKNYFSLKQKLFLHIIGSVIAIAFGLFYIFKA